MPRKALIQILSTLMLIPILLSMDRIREGNLALENGDIKRAIHLYENSLLEGNTETKSALRSQLAVAYFLDQEKEKAIQYFVKALDDAPVHEAKPISNHEFEAYHTCLKLYLDNPGDAACEVATQIQQSFLPLTAIHPEYYQLNFLVALAYANQQQYDEFFKRFYTAYLHYPDHFLAFKTKALLNYKLLQRAKTPAERQYFRNLVFENAMKALEKYKHDISLYRMCLDFSEKEKKSEVVSVCLNNMLQANILVPRSDITFYVKEAVNAGHIDLAQDLLARCKEFYPNSRSLTIAETWIQSHRNLKERHED